MDALRTGIYTVFTAAPGGVNNALYAALGGRLFYGNANGMNLAEGEYAYFFPVSSNPADTFTEERRVVYLQFSIFSGSSSPAKIAEIAGYLIDLLKDKPFSMTGYVVEEVRLLSDSLPVWVQGETEAAGDGEWQDDVEFKITVSKS